MTSDLCLYSHDFSWLASGNLPKATSRKSRPGAQLSQFSLLPQQVEQVLVQLFSAGSKDPAAVGQADHPGHLRGLVQNCAAEPLEPHLLTWLSC